MMVEKRGAVSEGFSLKKFLFGKINRKLILGFLLIAVIPIIFISFIFVYSIQETSFEFETIAKTKANSIDIILKDRVNEAELLALSTNVRNAVVEANQKYLDKSDEEIMNDILQIDEPWIASKKTDVTAAQILNNELSGFLKKYQERDNQRYGEIFVTDIKGAAVGMTKILSDYYQADEQWWTGARDDGMFIDDRGYDETVNCLVVGIVVPVKEKGEVIGILKINYKVTEILDIITGTKLGESDYTFLVRSQGTILIHPKGDVTLTDVEKNILTKEESGQDKDVHEGIKNIIGYSPLKTKIYTRVPSPGERKGVSGEKWEETTWYLIIEMHESEAFASIYDLRDLMLIFGVGFLIIIVILGLFISRSISKPIKKLHQATEEVEKGNLKVRVDIKSNDEVEQLGSAFNATTEKLRKLIEQIKQSEEKFRALVETTPDWIWEVNSKGVYTYASPRIKEILGYNPKEIIGKTPFDSMPKEEAKKIGKVFGEIIKKKKAFTSLENWNIHKNGKKVLLGTSGVPILDEKGQLEGYRGIDRDITERKKAENELKKAYAKLKTLDKAKDQFISMASHELKSPLIPTMGYTEMMLRGEFGKITPKQKKALEVSYRNVRNLRDLINDFLDLSRLDLKRIEINKKRENITKIAKEAIANLKEYAIAQKAQVKIDAPDKLIVNCDQLRINQVFTNLIKNAILYGKPNKPNKIDVILTKDTKQVTVKVKDQGQGIPKDKIGKLFNRFYRAEQAVRSPTAGTGLGLVITEGLIKLHGGDIKVESKEGVGSTFTFIIPLK